VEVLSKVGLVLLDAFGEGVKFLGCGGDYSGEIRIRRFAPLMVFTCANASDWVNREGVKTLRIRGTVAHAFLVRT
jgi:hypothetical protein